MKSEVQKFYDWMQSINNAYLSDHEQMKNAFRIVALENENNELKAKLRKVREMVSEAEEMALEMEVNYEIVKPN